MEMSFNASIEIDKPFHLFFRILIFKSIFERPLTESNVKGKCFQNDKNNNNKLRMSALTTFQNVL